MVEWLRVLSTDMAPPKPISLPLDEKSLGMCENYILGLVQVPNLTYEKRDLVARAVSEGFRLQLIEEALKRLTRKNSLKYSQITEGYSLP